MSNEFKTVRECELAALMQAHFRRFVESARIVLDPRTGEPTVLVEFRNGVRDTETDRRVA